MNISELLQLGIELEACGLDGTEKECAGIDCANKNLTGIKSIDVDFTETPDMATKPAEMEQGEYKEIDIKEPKLDCEDELSVRDVIKQLEDFGIDDIESLKATDPDVEFDMIDNKQPLKECDKQLIPDKEKEERAEELKKTRSKRSVSPKMESVAKDVVIAKYETKDGKHQIVRTADGLYKNRYFLSEDGKARRVTKGVKTLPTAVGALMRRFPKAEEVK